ALVALTALIWRSAWKYQARSYRYCFWDSGTILAHLLATATAADLPAHVIAGFIDTRLDRLLGVDGIHEASLCLVSLGPVAEVPSAPSDVPALRPKIRPLSREEVEYPAIQAVHDASSLDDSEGVRQWKGSLSRKPDEVKGETSQLVVGENLGGSLGETILRRGSTRHFRRTPIADDQLGPILHFATRGFEADFLQGTETRLVDLYLIVNEVTGVPPGAYYYAGDRPQLELLKEGDFRQWAGFLGLEQALPADASAVVFFLADLERVLGRFGNRGYRIAQLEAGVLGGRMYLAAYGLSLGATGLTFYDDEIVDFFSPHAEGKDAIFMVALGRGVRVRSNVRRVQAPFADQGS
ncbi:MAG: nitroreductase family protein, partial [Thermoplasmata archaeon]